MFQPINVVRLDERTSRIYVLIGDTIQIEIYPNGEVTLSMTKPNYQAMSDNELRDWVRYHPRDTDAFHILMDRLDQRPKVITHTDEEFETELQRRISQTN